MTAEGAGLDLYWIPLGAGARVVRVCGAAYEALVALLGRRPRRGLYHSALVARIGDHEHVMEMTPVPRTAVLDRGVVAEGSVGMRGAGRVRVFRYEVRRWRDGVLPDRGYAVSSPVHITSDVAVVERVLDLIAAVPTPVWGRDENAAGEMWNSNSVISWTLTRAGVGDAAGLPPVRGRAPGWDAGVEVARRSTPVPRLPVSS